MLKRFCDCCGKVMTPADNEYPIVLYNEKGWAISVDIKAQPDPTLGDICHECAIGIAQYGSPDPDHWQPQARQP